jgi:hypothetical protein
MSYQDISKRRVDTAAPLEFSERSARQELTITIHATIGGFDTEICFSGQLDQLEAITRRLRDLGASPAGVHQLAPAAAPAQQASLNAANGHINRKPAERMTQAYDGAGQPMCPVHHKPLTEGRYGLYCPSRADGEHANQKGYCNIRFAE